MIMKSQAFPWMRFEWHPGDHKVYVVRQKRDNPTIAHAIAFMENITTEVEAKRAIDCFLAGYRHRAREKKLYDGSNPHHRSMVLETGKVGARFT